MVSAQVSFLGALPGDQIFDFLLVFKALCVCTFVVSCVERWWRTWEDTWQVYGGAVLYTEAPPSRPWEDTGRTRGGVPAASLTGGTAVTLLKPMELNQTDYLETSDDAKIFKMVKDYNQI